MTRLPADPPPDHARSRADSVAAGPDDTSGDRRLGDEILAELRALDEIAADLPDDSEPDSAAHFSALIDQIRSARPAPRVEPDWDRMAADIRQACDDPAADPPGWLARLRHWLDAWLQPRYAVGLACCAAATIALVVVSTQSGPETPVATSTPTDPTSIDDPALALDDPDDGDALESPEDEWAAEWDGDLADESLSGWPNPDSALALVDPLLFDPDAPGDPVGGDASDSPGDDVALDPQEAALLAELATALDDSFDPELDSAAIDDPSAAGSDDMDSSDSVLPSEMALEWAELDRSSAAGEPSDELAAPAFDDLDSIADQELDSWLDGLSEEELDALDAALAG